MKVLGNLSGASNVAAWVIAGGLALGFQYWRQRSQNSGTISDAERDAFNAKRKAETTAATAAPADKQ